MALRWIKGEAVEMSAKEEEAFEADRAAARAKTEAQHEAEASKPFEQRITEKLGLSLNEFRDGLGVTELDTRLKAVEEKPEVARVR